MSTQNDPSPNTLSDGVGTASADGGGTVEQTTLSLSELNQYLGKDFKDKDSALKAFKDTFAYVGKRKEDIEREVRASLPGTPGNTPSPESKVQSLEEEVFYLKNPQFRGYEAIIKKMGSNPAEVVASNEFKTVFEKAKVADEVEQRRSVVASNPRLAQTKSYLDDAVKVANATRSTENVAAVLASAVVEELNNS